MLRFRNIVVLTGSGISAESGISTFRDTSGIWAQYDYRDVATPEGFRRNPALVLSFYNMRRQVHREVRPNAAHEALARLEREHTGSVLVVTQNVDSLHERAGSRNLIHMHGEIARCLCNACGARSPNDRDLAVDTACGHCGAVGALRPDVVWFGEMPYQLDRIGEAIGRCDLFLSIGTSGTVYPAAGFVAAARAAGAYTVELNLEPSQGASLFHETHHGPATRIVPDYVDRLLAR